MITITYIIKKFCKHIRIEKNSSIAYYLQTNRKTKKFDQEIEQYLWLYINYKQDNWVE